MSKHGEITAQIGKSLSLEGMMFITIMVSLAIM